MMRIGVNGLGRIGRLFVREAHMAGGLSIVHLNDPMEPELAAHLMRHDSAHGPWHEAPEADEDGIGEMAYTRRAAPGEIPWKDAGVTHVLESSGRFTRRAQAAHHLDAGAQRVVISAPSADADATVVLGVNDDVLRSRPVILSNASCTTNAVANLLAVLHDRWTVEHAFLNTVHCYTSSQNLVDGANPDWRRARAASASMVPTSTTAEECLTHVMPDLAGRFEAIAVRVPVLDVSLVDLVVRLQRPAKEHELAAAFEEEAQGDRNGILDVCDEELVGVDFLGSPMSVTVDLPHLCSLGDTVRVIGWYDNEMGYAHRLLDLFRHLAKD